MKTLLRWLARRCDIHDAPWPRRKLAEMELAAGLKPMPSPLRSPDLVEDHYDPDIVDCGREWCRRRRQGGKQ